MLDSTLPLSSVPSRAARFRRSAELWERRASEAGCPEVAARRRRLAAQDRRHADELDPPDSATYRALLVEMLAATDATMREQGGICGPRLARAMAAASDALSGEG